MKPYAFGIDLGGTTAKIGLFTPDGTVLEKWQIDTDTSDKGVRILPNLADAVRAKMDEKGISADDVIGVGIGVPGAVKHASYVPVCANLGGWGDLSVSDTLSALLGGMPVKTGNDANVAALGEFWVGSAKNYSSLALVTLGTGVGGGVIINGQIVEGGNGAGGEIGHLTVNRDETCTCGCGKTGCLEQYSSATGVVRLAKRNLAASDKPSMLSGKEFVAKDVFDAAREGDEIALASVDEMTNYLGYALANIAATIDPEVFLLGGGVSRAGEILTDRVTTCYQKYAFSASRYTPILLATLGNDAGMYGAVRLILE